MKEIWKEIPGYEGYYEASNTGLIKSVNRTIRENNGRLRILVGVILKERKAHNGYLHVRLAKNGICKTLSVHRIIALLFIPNPFNLPQVNHKDEVKSNNNEENLEWCTPKYNMAYGKGHVCGEQHGSSKLSINRVISIFSDHREYKFISNEYGVSKTVVSNIKLKRSWKHIVSSL